MPSSSLGLSTLRLVYSPHGPHSIATSPLAASSQARRSWRSPPQHARAVPAGGDPQPCRLALPPSVPGPSHAVVTHRAGRARLPRYETSNLQVRRVSSAPPQRGWSARRRRCHPQVRVQGAFSANVVPRTQQLAYEDCGGALDRRQQGTSSWEGTPRSYPVQEVHPTNPAQPPAQNDPGDADALPQIKIAPLDPRNPPPQTPAIPPPLPPHRNSQGGTAGPHSERDRVPAEGLRSCRVPPEDPQPLYSGGLSLLAGGMAWSG